MCQREPEWESQRAIESQEERLGGGQKETVRARGNQSELEKTRKSHGEPE